MENECLKKLKREVHKRRFKEVGKGFFLSIVPLIDEILENDVTNNMDNF